MEYTLSYIGSGAAMSTFYADWQSTQAVFLLDYAGVRDSKAKPLRRGAQPDGR